MFPRAELNDPITARKKLAELSAKAPASDNHGMEIEEPHTRGRFDSHLPAPVVRIDPTLT